MADRPPSDALAPGARRFTAILGTSAALVLARRLVATGGQTGGLGASAFGSKVQKRSENAEMLTQIDAVAFERGRR
jgi:hypothetical protein